MPDKGSGLYVKLVGTGSPLVFLHGFLEDHAIWNPVYPDFVNEGFRCILFDLPCHGQSRFDGSVCTMEHMAREVADWLRQENSSNPFVIGHSMGGYVGLELLRLMPARLVLLHSNFWTDSESKKRDRDRVIEVVKRNKSLFLSEAIPNLFAPANREFRREEIAGLIARAGQLDAAEIAAATGGLRDRRSSHDVMNAFDVALIHGSDDPIIPEGILAAEMAKLERKPLVHRIDNCGHMSFIEQPAQLINHLRTIVFR